MIDVNDTNIILDKAHSELKKKFSNGYELVVLSVVGSHSYGTNTDISDIDIKGIYLPPAANILGLDVIEHIQLEKFLVSNNKEVEGILYSFNKWINLVIKQNPSIITLLWNTPDLILESSKYWKYIDDFKYNLLSKRLKTSCIQYVNAQSWRAMRINLEKNVNEKRADDIKKVGYSTKNMVQIIYLLSLAKSSLQSTGPIVKIKDTKFIHDILNYKYSYDELNQFIDKEIQEIEELSNISSLQESLNLKNISNFKVKLLLEWLNGKK